jgi:hypothetical protein
MPRIVSQCSDENAINRGAQTEPPSACQAGETLLGGEDSRAQTPFNYAANEQSCQRSHAPSSEGHGKQDQRGHEQPGVVGN